MPTKKHLRITDTVVTCVKSATNSETLCTPRGQNTQPHNGNSSAKKTPPLSLSDSLGRVSAVAEKVGVNGDISPMAIMHYFGELILDAPQVTELYESRKASLLTQRNNEFKAIITEAFSLVKKVELLKGPNEVQKLLDYCIEHVDDFMNAVRYSDTHMLEIMISKINVSALCNDTPSLLRGFKYNLLTQAFKIEISKIRAQEIDPHHIDPNVLRFCYQELSKTSIQQQDVIKLQPKELALRYAQNIKIDTVALQRGCLAQLLHRAFYVEQKKYYDTYPVSVNTQQSKEFGVDFLVHCLLSHRSSSMLMANGKVGAELYQAGASKKQQHISSFTYSATNYEVTECSILYWTGSKASKIPALGTYDKIADTLRAMTNIVPDQDIAAAIMNILQGITPNIYNDRSVESTKALQFLTNLTHLLFVTEPSRNKSALITNAMFLDLVKQGQHKMTDIVDLPMSICKAVKGSRALSDITSNALPFCRKYDHSSFQELPSSSKVSELLKKAEKVYGDWMKSAGNPSDIQATFCTAIARWFHVNIKLPIPEVECVTALIGMFDAADEVAVT